jgi:FkbM family methyltransferase
VTTLDAPTAGSEQSPEKTGVVARLKDFLRPFFLRARTGLLRRGAVPSWEQSFRVLSHHGLRPATVFDIGVAYGTYELYRAFPDAHYHLIDPTRESLHHMRLLSRQLRCDIHAVALGNRDGETTIEIRPDIQAATLLEDVTPREIVRHDRVPLRRFDSLIGEIARPALAKIDVQGAELMVLEGMTGRMASMDAVVRFMHDHGFVVADIVGLTRRPLDGATAQLDLLFLPEQDSPVRRDRRWSEAA